MYKAQDEHAFLQCNMQATRVDSFFFLFFFFSSGSIEEKGGKRLSSKDIVDTAQSQPLMDHLLHMMLFVRACLRVLSGSTTSLNTTLQLVKRQKE